MNKHDVYAGSWKGELGVWQLDPARKTLATKYIMERESVPRLSLRQLSAVVQHKGKYYLGDGGPNIKVLDWKKRKYVFSLYVYVLPQPIQGPSPIVTQFLSLSPIFLTPWLAFHFVIFFPSLLTLV